METLLKKLSPEEQYLVLQKFLDPILRTQADFIRIPAIIQQTLNEIRKVNQTFTEQK